MDFLALIILVTAIFLAYGSWSRWRKLGSNHQDNSGLRRCWWYACLEENINLRKATRLPLLFAIDRKLFITDGFTYSLDCKKKSKNGTTSSSHSSSPYCAGDFSSSSVDGSTEGWRGHRQQ